MELLDTPGILWPKFEDQKVGQQLAFIGSIKDELLNQEELALELIRFLISHYPGTLEEKYSSGEEALQEAASPVEILTVIARNRQCLGRGGELDLEKAARLVLDDFRGGRLGRITLEYPEEM